MALSINTTLPTLLFTSQLPDVIISATYAEVTVTLKVGGTAVHTATLFPYSGTATFADLRSIVEEEMLARAAFHTTVQVVVSASNGNVTASSATARVVFCRHALPDATSATSFLSTHFLTTCTVRQQPRSIPISLYGMAAAGETISLAAVYIVERSNGEKKTLSQTISNTTYSTAASFYFSATTTQLLQRARTLQSDTIRLLAVTIWAGYRSSTFFFTDTDPDFSFLYLNPFAIFETLPVTGITRTLDEKTFSTATLARTIVHYDIQNERTYRTLLAALTEEEATRVSELRTSTDVRLIDPAIDDFNDYPPVLVEAVDCEPSDTDDGLHEATIEWRFADRRPHLMKQAPTTPAGIFTSEYNPTFT